MIELDELEQVRRKLDYLEKKCESLTQKLRESEERFCTLVRASSNPIAITTVIGGRIVDINEKFADLLGFSREELVGHTITESDLLANPQQSDVLKQKLEADGIIHNFEMMVKTKAGEIRTLLLSADPITVDDESCLLGIAIDITEQKEEADALRRSEEKHRMLVENSLQGLAIIQDGRIVFCNRAYAEISGYSVSELLSFEDTISLIHPDDRGLILARYRDRLLGAPAPPHYEHRIIRKDGTERWVEIHASPVEYNRSPAIQIVDMDITERKRVEQALVESNKYLSQIINCIGDPIFVKDRHHRFVLVNDALCSSFGKRHEELIGKTSSEVFPNEPASLWHQEETIFQTGSEHLSEDHLSLLGNPFVVMAKKTLLIDKGGNQQIIGILRDITEQKRLQAQLLQSQKMEAVGMLAGGVAHDFNNLLSVIKGYTELLLEDCEPSDPKYSDLEQVAKAGQRAATLTSQLLAFSRKQVLQPQNLDLNVAIAEMSTMLSRVIGEDIEFINIVGPDLGLVYADPAQIQQVLMNLVVNARDAMPEGGKLTIETANVDFDENYARRPPMMKKGAYVMLAVSDTGAGMDSETQSRMFEPFFTTKEKGRGTGLGLAMVYGIVKQSDGFIWVYSDLGKGTTFKICFPRLQGTASQKAVKESPTHDSRGCETVLLVEDEGSVRRLASRILQQQGYEVIEASDGMEALRIAEEFSGDIHLVLTDVIMPGMSGKALVPRLEAMRPGIRSLYFSGYTDNVIVNPGTPDSDVAFLQKPFTVESLIRKVRAVIDSP